MTINATSFKADVQRVLILGNQQLTAAKAEQWDEVEDLEKQRLALIKQTIREPVSDALAPLVKLAIEKIQQQEAKLLKMAKEQKLKTSDQLRALQKGNKANKAYGQSRGLPR